MIDTFCRLIIARPQRKTIDQVPLSIRQQVIDKLKEMGYDENGDPINS